MRQHHRIELGYKPAGEMRFGRSSISPSSLPYVPQFKPVDAGIGAVGITGAIMFHDGLRASVRMPGDVADGQQIAAGTIEQHDASVAQVLVVFLVKLAGGIDEHQRLAWLQEPCCIIAIAVARCLRIEPFSQRTRTLIDSAGTLRFVLFIERETREQPVDSSAQFGSQPRRADDRLPRIIACEKAEHGNRARSGHPMPISALVVRLAIVLVDDELDRYRANASLAMVLGRNG
jgi:hypothetical protein